MDKEIKIYPPIWIPLFMDIPTIEKNIVFYGEYDKRFFIYVKGLSKLYDKVIVREGQRVWHKTALSNLPDNVAIEKEEIEFPFIPHRIGEGRNKWDVNIIYPLSLYWNKLKSVCSNYKKLNGYQKYRLTSLLYLIENGGVELIYPFLWLNGYALECFLKIVNGY